MSTNFANQPSAIPDEIAVQPTQRKPPAKATENKLQASTAPSAKDTGIEDQIRERAYQLYLQRGSREGHDLQDWLDAEFELHANR